MGNDHKHTASLVFKRGHGRGRYLKLGGPWLHKQVRPATSPIASAACKRTVYYEPIETTNLTLL